MRFRPLKNIHARIFRMLFRGSASPGEPTTGCRTNGVSEPRHQGRRRAGAKPRRHCGPVHFDSPRLGRLICVTGWAVAGVGGSGCGMSCLALTEPRLAVRSALAGGAGGWRMRTGRLAKGNAGAEGVCTAAVERATYGIRRSSSPIVSSYTLSQRVFDSAPCSRFRFTLFGRHR
jgi:hypothetical protein